MLEILDDGVLLSDEFTEVVNFIIEEVFIDGVSFDSSLVLFRPQLQLVILAHETLVLMHQFGYGLLSLF